MLIIPTKEAQSLFSDLPQTQNKIDDQEHAFFTWHATRFTINDNPVLLLVNDLTLSPIVLTNINLENQSQLIEDIQTGIKKVLSFSYISKSALEHYLSHTEAIEINLKENPSIISVMNDMIKHAQDFAGKFDFKKTVQQTVMMMIAQIPYRTEDSGYVFSIDAVEHELDAWG